MKFKLLVAYLWPLWCMGWLMLFMQLGVWVTGTGSGYYSPTWWSRILLLAVLWGAVTSIRKTFSWSIRTIRENRTRRRQRPQEYVRPPGT